MFILSLINDNLTIIIIIFVLTIFHLYQNVKFSLAILIYHADSFLFLCQNIYVVLTETLVNVCNNTIFCNGGVFNIISCCWKYYIIIENLLHWLLLIVLVVFFLFFLVDLIAGY